MSTLHELLPQVRGVSGQRCSQSFCDTHLLLLLSNVVLWLVQACAWVGTTMISTPMTLLSAVPTTRLGFLAVDLVASEAGLH